VSPADEVELEAAEDRHGLLMANEFQVRLAKRKAALAGDGDVIALLLDLRDPHARRVHDDVVGAIRAVGKLVTYGQTAADNGLRLLTLPWPPFREQFSPNHRAVFDRARPDDTRVAVMSGGHTLAAVVPGDRKLEDVPQLVVTQTESDRAAGCTSIPSWVFDHLGPGRPS
jgi:hypothetical protein